MQSRVMEIWNHLHAIPEPSEHEEKTAAYLAGELKKAGYEVHTGVATNGVIGVLRGKEPGPAVGVRGDMDALTHIVDGKSTLVHSCGHDANCAMVLTMAEAVAKSGLKRGMLKIIFQPAEELLIGALAMLDAGAIDDLEYMIGMHLRPEQEAKFGQATAALCHGATGFIEASIRGVTSHGARPHLGVNAIDAAVLVVNALGMIWENPAEGWSLKTTKFNSNGVLTNAVPDGVELAIDIRAQTNLMLDSVVKKATTVVETAPKAIGGVGEIKIAKTIPGSEYDQEVVALLADAITDAMGQDALIPPIITSGGDDFHFYKKMKPSLKVGFVGLGADLTPGLHNPAMTFNHDAMPSGVKILRNAVDKLLN